MASNLNFSWAKIIVEEMVRWGVRYACLSPGSRSAPLALAAAEHPDMTVDVHFDERGAAFAVLGWGKEKGSPALFISTSGTAVANALPAVVEAHSSSTPLLLATADRPPEEMNVGANQTIDQVKIFGGYVNQFIQLPCPDAKIDPGYILGQVDELCRRAVLPHPGPVHMNCMYRKPLEPSIPPPPLKASAKFSHWLERTHPFTISATSIENPPSRSKVNTVFKRKFSRPLILIGDMERRNPRQIARVLDRFKWSVYTETALSLTAKLRDKRRLLSHLDLWVDTGHLRPDIILHLGGKITSGKVLELVRSLQGPYVMIDEFGKLFDPGHRIDFRITAPIGPTLKIIHSLNRNVGGEKFMETGHRLDVQTASLVAAERAKHKQLSEMDVACEIASLLPPGYPLLMGNSMPIRDFIAFSPKDRAIAVFANRGASGIDGSVATAFGLARSSGKPVTLVIGDLSLLHDASSLGLLSDPSIRMAIVVLNNQGGGIFSYLPIKNKTPHFDKIFRASHDLRFEFIARQFGLQYQNPCDLRTFQRQLKEALRRSRSTLIEIAIPKDKSVRQRRRLEKKIRTILSPG